MKWFIAVAAVLAVALVLQAQMAVTSQVATVQSTHAITFGTAITVDTTLVTGATASDKYFVTPTSNWASNGDYWVEAAAGMFIVHTASAETGATANVLRTQ